MSDSEEEISNQERSVHAKARQMQGVISVVRLASHEKKSVSVGRLGNLCITSDFFSPLWETAF